MMKKTHLKGGIISGLAISYIANNILTGTNPEALNAMLIISGSAIGSLLPDIDHPQSYMGRKLPLFSGLLNLIHKISKKLKMKRTQKFYGHRGFMHSLVFWTLLCLLVFLVSKNEVLQVLTIGIFIGVLSHILLDVLTVSGVPILMPLTFKNFKIPIVRTNGLSEKIFSGILTVAIIFTAVYLYKKINFEVISFLNLFSKQF